MGKPHHLSSALIEMADGPPLTLEGILSLSSSSGTTIDGDTIWTFLGRTGRYQLFQTFLMILGGLGFTTAILGVVFTGHSVDFTCTYDNVTTGFNVSSKTSSCEVSFINNASHVVSKEDCLSHEFEGDTPLSYIAEWDLVCDKETVGQLPQTIAMVGMAVGSSLLPPLADRFGRKRLILVSQLLTFFILGAMALIQNFEVFLVLKFLAGAFNQSNMIGLLTMLLELYTKSLRSAVSFIHTCMWLASGTLLVPFAYGLGDSGWRSLQLAYAFFSLPVVFYAWFYDESLKWLLANSKVKQAEIVMKKACRWNGKNYDHLLKIMKDDIIEAKKLGDESRRIKDAQDDTIGFHTILLVLKNKTLRKVTLISCYVCADSLTSREKETKRYRPSLSELSYPYARGINHNTSSRHEKRMTCSMTYYGLILLSTSLPGNPYVNFMVINVLELVAGVTMWISIQRYGRKRPLICFMLGAAVCLIASVLVNHFTPDDYEYSLFLTALTQLGKFCITGSFCIIWLITPELYPTNLRNFGTGLSATAARIASVVTPFFNILAKRALWAPAAVFGLCCLVAVFLITFLPETRWKELPKSVEDVESFFVSHLKRKPEPGDGKKKRRPIFKGKFEQESALV